MGQRSLAKNYMYQFIYQTVMLVLPLIISPYLTRTLQETSLGVYSYTHSISYYFVIVAMLGISRHGQRIIAQNSHDQIALRKTFWSLYSLHATVSLVVMAGYVAYVALFVKEHTSVFWIETLYVASALFDITWFFYGLEDFRSIVIKNAIIKISECLLIFALVHKPTDLWKYSLIMSTGILLGQVVMIPQAIRIAKPIRFSKQDVLSHIKPLLIFSVAVIASTLYTVFDKTLLGIMTCKENVAFYEYSDKIISVPRTLISVIGTVMFPRACKLAAAGKADEQRQYIKYSVYCTSFISGASILGLTGVATEFATMYYGSSFAICGKIMIALSPVIYIVGMGEIVRTQYMIPNNMDVQHNISLVLNAIINIILSILLIPKMGVFGAVLGTLSAELCGLIFQCFLCRRYISWKDIVLPTFPFVGFGLIMLMALHIMNEIFASTLEFFIIKICIAGLVYCVLTGTYLYLFKKSVWGKVIGVIGRKRC